MKVVKRHRLFALLASFTALAAAAIEPQDATPPAPEPAPPAAESKTPADADAGREQAAEAGSEEELPPLPAAAAPSGPPPQRFNPTEKVRADFPVSFPIDI